MSLHDYSQTSHSGGIGLILTVHKHKGFVAEKLILEVNLGLFCPS
jgi:hypothetical protein